MSGRVWKMWATRRTIKHGDRVGQIEYWNIGSKFFVDMHYSEEPTVSVLVEEVTPTDATHFGWEDTKKPGKVSMIFPRVDAAHLTPTMFLDMCFPYGLKAAIAAGDGTPVALRITEQSDTEEHNDESE